ncbi:MAG TPA: hypothetical protein VEO53_11830, partial [Candidatus Binatia bacterium]|nr:hypothetical protein [Candidatus Binatia bacterium]
TLSATNPPIVIDLQLADRPVLLTGSIRDGTRTGHLVGYRFGPAFRANPAAPFVGYYTLAFSGGTEPATSPFGHGFGTVRIKPNGRVLFQGTLADGSPLAQIAPLALRGPWPIYAPLYKRRGLILGWITTNTDAGDLEGVLVWRKPGGSVGPFYPAGFTNVITALGSRYSTPPARARLLDFTNAVILLEGGNLSARATNEVILQPRAQVIVAPPNSNELAVAVDPKTGRFRGSFVNPQTHTRTVVRGAVLRKNNRGAGYFLGTDQSGAVYFGPPEDFPLLAPWP